MQQIQNQGSLQASSVVAANAKVQGDKQTVASLQATLNALDPNMVQSQAITTGRSTTHVGTTGANPVYQGVQQQLATAQATLK